MALKRALLMGWEAMDFSGNGTAFDQSSRAESVRRLRSPSSRCGGLTLHLCPEGHSEMPYSDELSGMAALSICESLLLAMNDHKLLPEREIVGVLVDAAATHENAAGPGVDVDMHRAVASLINRIIAGGNSVRRP